MASFLGDIGNGLSHIADNIMGLGDIFSAWGGESNNPGAGVNLRYPSDLGEGGDIFSKNAGEFIFNSSQASNNSSITPYISFQLFKPVMEDGFELKNLTKTDANMMTSQPTGETIITAEPIVVDGVKGSYAKETLEIAPPKLKYVPQHNISLYMTPAITVADAIHYETGSRAAAAFTQGVANGDVSWDDATMAASHWGAATLTGAAGITSMGSSSMAKWIAGAVAGGAAAVNIIGDEYKRLTGKVFNPNEYLQFKNAQLRTIDLTFKFLPNSSQESRSAAQIIKTFRAAMRPKRLTAVTMEAPYQCQITFMGAGDMSQYNPCYITQASVTYNPNSASFFNRDGNPVEIDFNLQLQEIFPIYRDDVENAGHMAGPSAQGFKPEAVIKPTITGGIE